MNLFTRDTWQEQLSQSLNGLRDKATELGIDSIFSLSLAAVLTPAIAALSRGDMAGIFSVGVAIGTNIIANYLETLQQKSLDEQAKFLHEEIKKSPELRTESQKLLEELNALEIAMQNMDDADRQWYEEQLNAELSDWNQTLALENNSISMTGNSNIFNVSFEPITKEHNLFITSISITNIRCFENLKINLRNSDGTPTTWNMFIGDNAMGKSTLLRSIAIGLADEHEAIAMLSETKGGYVRHGYDEGFIDISLQDENHLETFELQTRIFKKGRDEIVRKVVSPANFEWSDVFVCGYGTNRSSFASESIEDYSPRLATRTLFNYQATLQNPEVILLRLAPRVSKNIERKLFNILMLDPEEYQIESQKSGLEMSGPWGNNPFESLSDGYRTTAQWVIDYIGWMIFSGRIKRADLPGGILLIDEIEQHLHPRWQRYIVKKFREQFPNTQIFSTTHTPLVASSMADIDQGKLMALSQDWDGSIKARVIDTDQLDGKRADQVLSTAFELPTSRNPGSQDDIDRYIELFKRKEKLTNEEIKEFKSLQTKIQNSSTKEESQIALEFRRYLENEKDELLANISPEMFNAEVLKVLRKDDNKGE